MGYSSRKKLIKKNIFFLIFFLFSTKVFCCDVVLEINKDKTYYLKTISSTATTFNLIIKSGSISIKEINPVNNDNIFDFKKNRELNFVFTKKNNSLKKRLKLEIEDNKGKKYFLTLLFYSDKFNIDEIPITTNIQYNKSKDYPFILTSNSHIIGNYYIFNEFREQIFEFEILSFFSVLIDSLKAGNYVVCENNINNPLFSLTINN